MQQAGLAARQHVLCSKPGSVGETKWPMLCSSRASVLWGAARP